ncbi:hypothetical protein [Okeania sp. SIO2C9]|nr:hypothetical protein [Okeania sp. SIO2C9]
MAWRELVSKPPKGLRSTLNPYQMTITTVLGSNIYQNFLLTNKIKI